MDWIENEKKNLEFLDTIDFIPYLKKNGSIKEVINGIQTDYSNKNMIPDFLEGYVFNNITDEEVLLYLRDRYNITAYEYIDYYYILPEDI